MNEDTVLVNEDEVVEDNQEEVTETLPTDVNEDSPNDSYLNVLKKIADALWKKKGVDNYVNKADNRLDALIEIKEAIRGTNIDSITDEEEKLEYIKNQPKTLLQGVEAILNAINEVDDTFNMINYPEDYAPEVPVKFNLYDALIDGDAFKDNDYQKDIKVHKDGCLIGTLIMKKIDETATASEEGTEAPVTEKSGFVITIDTSSLDETISSLKAFMINANEQTTIITDNSIEVFVHDVECWFVRPVKDKLCIVAYDENDKMLDTFIINLRNVKLIREVPTDDEVSVTD